MMNRFGRGLLGAALLLLGPEGCDRRPTGFPARSSGVLNVERGSLPRTPEELARLVPPGTTEKEILRRLGRPFLVVPADPRLCLFYYEYQPPLTVKDSATRITGFSLLLENQVVKEATFTYREPKAGSSDAPAPDVALGEKWVVFKGLREGAEDYGTVGRLWVAVPEPGRKVRVPLRLQLDAGNLARLNTRLKQQGIGRVAVEVDGIPLGPLTVDGPLSSPLSFISTNGPGVLKLIQAASASR
jgi:hypothetical protein